MDTLGVVSLKTRGPANLMERPIVTPTFIISSTDGAGPSLVRVNDKVLSHERGRNSSSAACQQHLASTVWVSGCGRREHCRISPHQLREPMPLGFP